MCEIGLSFQVGSETNRDIMVQRWGIYAFCTSLWDMKNWWEGWLIAVQMINDSTHADKISPAIFYVQNIYSHTGFTHPRLHAGDIKAI